jgi:acetyl/propionyl-CoA carboxylase alpha subunit
MIRRLLVANRGEIAVRIIRAAREMGIQTVAVFSEADAQSTHARLADEAVGIGPAEASQSYLCSDKIVRAAIDSHADAVHPGYGFLAESAEFADACERAGLTFVGPSREAMLKLGAKIQAKRLAVSVGVPVVPGHFELGATAAQLKKAASKIGYPVMLKASAGGGGRGMKIVSRPDDFDHAVRLASEEAEKAFGDGSMMVEKLIERPRHIEVQILADGLGSAVALFERECSIQRRHQKLIEESPSPLWEFWSRERHGGEDSPRGPGEASLWPELRNSALALAQASGYRNAGTVEFIVDPETGAHYFLEVNARLQVEHPVTEALAGIDLVKWQLRIAGGEELRLPSDLVAGVRSAMRGHAIEARIVAENPSRGFLPSVGRIEGWAEPRIPGVRVDTGFGAGDEVSRHYDSLLAKVIAHAETRDEAISRLRAALMDFHVLGVSTNIAFLLDVLEHPGFRAGSMDTGFLEREFTGWDAGPIPAAELGAIVRAAGTQDGLPRPAIVRAADRSAFGLGDGFRSARAEK